MIRRPLGFVCLMISLILYLLVIVKQEPCVDYSMFEGKMITVEGKVYKKEMIRQTNGWAMVLYIKLISGNGGEEDEMRKIPPGKKAVCYLKTGQKEPEMGSTIRLTGKFSSFERASNPGQFDAHSYYQILKISYRLNQATISAKSKNYNLFLQTVYQIRGYFSEKLLDALPEKEAAVMQTMLLGEKGGMDGELKALYQRNGIAHILAISGLHLSMIGMGLYQLLRKCRVPMKAAAAFSTAVMLLYGTMTGFSVSSVRAIIMFSLHMTAIFTKRTYDMLTAVAVAAVLILLYQPLYLKHSGFVFSFGCVLGIGLILPALTEGRKERNPAIKGILGGFGMMVITLPIYLWYYFQFPVYSVLLNLLIIPLMSFLMAAGLMLIVSSILCPAASLPFALLIQGILKVYESSCKICDMLPGNQLTLGRPEEWQIMAYFFMLILIVFIRKRVRVAARWGIAVVSMLCVMAPLQKGLKITFLDVGQGDCICIENGHGSNYLIDGGSSTVDNVGEYRIIPFLKFRGISKLEAVFVTHPDEDHCNGIKELIKTGDLYGITVNHLVLPDISKDIRNGAYLELVDLAQEADIPVTYMSKGQKLADGKLILTCLHPTTGYQAKEANEYSMVLELCYEKFRAMFTGDVEGAGERAVTQLLQQEGREGRLTLLKAAHHGSKWSTSNEFLDSQMPVYTIISCGKNNSYGHPHKELLERLASHDTNTLNTAQTGAVTFYVDKRKARVKRFLKETDLSSAADRSSHPVISMTYASYSNGVRMYVFR